MTVVPHQRQRLFITDGVRSLLRRAIAQTRRERPFDLVASVLLRGSCVVRQGRSVTERKEIGRCAANNPADAVAFPDRV